MVYMEEFIFPRFFAQCYQKSMEFLSSLVFHTVTIQVIPHYNKQSLVQLKKTKQKKNKKKKQKKKTAE